MRVASSLVIFDATKHLMPRIVMGESYSLLRLVNIKNNNSVKITALFAHLVIITLSRPIY